MSHLRRKHCGELSKVPEIMKFYKTPDQSQKKIFSEFFDKNDTEIPFKTQILGTVKNLTLFYLRKIMKFFKILDHPINVSKIHLNASPKSVLEFKTRLSGTRIHLTPFWFCEKS